MNSLFAATVSGIVSILLAGAAVAPQTRTPARDAVQQPDGRRIPVGTGVVSGVVLSADTGRPVRNARVILNGTAGAAPAGGGNTAPAPESPGPPTLALNRSTFTDAQGQFTFARVAAGRYSLSASRDGYLATSFGQRRLGAAAYPFLELREGERRAVTLSMTRGGVFAGHVYDQDGEPMRNLSVQVWRIDKSGGVKRLQMQGSAVSNDRGAYRVFGLQPGEYLIAVVPRVTDYMNDRLAGEILTVEQAVATQTPRTTAGGGPPFVVVPQERVTTLPVATGSAFLPIYFPGTLSPTSARILTLGGGEELEGLDLTIQYFHATVITGLIVPPPPEGVSMQLMLVPANPMSATNTLSTSVNTTTGAFTFNNVPSGHYTLLGQATGSVARVIESSRISVDGKPVPSDLRVQVQTVSPGGGSRYWAQADVIVNGEPSLDVTVALHPARTLSGRVIFDMARPPANTQVSLQIVPGGNTIQLGAPPQVRVAEDGTFKLDGVVPGSYFLRTTGTTRSAMVGGSDLLDQPLVFTGDRDIGDITITLTDKVSQLTGTLADARGEPVGNRGVVVAPVDERYWSPGSRRILSVTTGPYGRYTFPLPPGDYVVAFVEDLEPGLQYDPEFLASVMATGTRVTITEGATVRQDLRIR